MKNNKMENDNKMENEQTVDVFNLNESIIWRGSPDQKKILCIYDFFAIPFSVFWLAFSIVWLNGTASIYLQYKNQMLIPILCVGIFFVAIGLYLLIGRFIYKNYINSHMNFVITNKRILFLFKNQCIKDLSIKNVDSINISCDKKGNGDIIFGNILLMEKIYFKTGMKLFLKVKNIANMFYNVSDCNNVYNILKEVVYK